MAVIVGSRIPRGVGSKSFLPGRRAGNDVEHGKACREYIFRTLYIVMFLVRSSSDLVYGSSLDQVHGPCPSFVGSGGGGSGLVVSSSSLACCFLKLTDQHDFCSRDSSLAACH